MNKFTLSLLLFFSILTVQANELATKYDVAIKTLNTEVQLAYEKAHLQMSGTEMLEQLKQIQTSFVSYLEVAREIKARFKQKDMHLYAELSDINSNYCKIEAKTDDTYTILAITNPELAPWLMSSKGEVVFKLKNYSDLKDLNEQLSREEFRIKTNKAKSKRYLRKLSRLQNELLFQD